MSDNNVTRDELKLHLDLVEEKASHRASVLDGKLDRVLDQLEGVRADYKNTRTAIIGTAIGAVGIILALIGLMAANQGTMTTANGNVLSAFQAGAAAEALKAPEPPLTPPSKVN